MIDVKSMAQAIKDDCKEKLKGKNPEYYLKIIQVEGDARSDAYVRGKKKDCSEIGLKCVHVLLSKKATKMDILVNIHIANFDKDCVGIILQLPLPEHLKQFEKELTKEISPEKDVDGFKTNSKFSPCTPEGIIRIMKNHYNNEPDCLSGKVVAVIGRGKLVGKPLREMLDKENATVISCNSHTDDWTLTKVLNSTDVVVTATGKPEFLRRTKQLQLVNMNTLVIDAGISKGENGKLCGDVEKEYYKFHDFVTSVPGGVGLMTRAILMEHCVKSIENKEKKNETD